MKKTKMLKKNYEFKHVLNQGKYYAGAYIQAFITENRNKKNNFLGIAIGVKIGKAVKRNHIKRLLRENYKNLENQIETGHSIVFLWKKKQDIANATYVNIEKDMNKIFEKAKIFIKE